MHGRASFCLIPGCGACVPGNEACEAEHALYVHSSVSPSHTISVFRDLYVLDYSDGPADRYQLCCLVCGNYCSLPVTRGAEPRLSDILRRSHRAMTEHQLRTHRVLWADLLTSCFKGIRTLGCLLCGWQGKSEGCLLHLYRAHPDEFHMLVGATPILDSAFAAGVQLME